MKFRYLLLSLAAIVIAGLTFHGIVNASPTITAYSVTNLQAASATDLGVTSYTATVSTTKNPKTKTKNFTNGDLITINAVNCTHVPAKGGEAGIVVVSGAATTLLFSDGGATCAVKSVTLTPKTTK